MWTKYYDYVVVDAQKPLYFEGGTTLRQIDEVGVMGKISLTVELLTFLSLVNQTTGMPRMGVFKGKIEEGSVYSGG